eukprot:3415583-Rhodomonas_salina.1
MSALARRDLVVVLELLPALLPLFLPPFPRNRVPARVVSLSSSPMALTHPTHVSTVSAAPHVQAAMTAHIVANPRRAWLQCCSSDMSEGSTSSSRKGVGRVETG